MGNEVTFRIKSKFDLIYPVEQAILAKAQEAGFDEDCCFSLRLAMDEALVNAIVHGNDHAEHKEIEVTAEITPQKISISVADEGNGFNQNNLSDPREEPYLHKTHGRGVFLIRQFTSDVFFNDKGNKITFVVDQTRPAPIMQISG
jgi:serine/threonine-protein kinase RsbW